MLTYAPFRHPVLLWVEHYMHGLGNLSIQWHSHVSALLLCSGCHPLATSSISVSGAVCAGKKILIRIRSERQGVTRAHNFYDKYVNWYKATERWRTKASNLLCNIATKWVEKLLCAFYHPRIKPALEESRATKGARRKNIINCKRHDFLTRWVYYVFFWCWFSADRASWSLIWILRFLRM